MGLLFAAILHTDTLEMFTGKGSQAMDRDFLSIQGGEKVPKTFSFFFPDQN